MIQERSEQMEIAPRLPLKVPIIKVVSSCNLRCDYCYYPKDQTIKILSLDLLKKFFEEYFELFPKDPFFFWHGGEPLHAGISFFENVVYLQRKFAQKSQIVKNVLVTNGTLVNDEWAQFFKAHDFKISVSLDGKSQTHDRFRKNNIGLGSFKDAIKGIKILQEYGINPAVLQVITSDTASQSKENFQFLVESLGIKRIGINIFLYEESINKKMVNQSVSNETLIDFFKNYIDLWLEKDDPDLSIREIDNFIAGVVGKRPLTCDFNSLCSTFFTLTYDGKIYPCDFFMNREDFVSGDITKQSLLEIFTGLKWQRFMEKVNKLPSECATCEWQHACHNGCSYHRVGGINGKYYYCQARKEILNYIKNKIQEVNFMRDEEAIKGTKAIKGAIERVNMDDVSSEAIMDWGNIWVPP